MVKTPFRMLDMDRSQWLVLFAAWLGWGFDAFDALLFNFVAGTCVQTVLGIAHGTPEAKAATLQWTGVLTSLLLVGWAIGGVVFGWVSDRIGRMRTMLLTMVIYSLGTAACAFAPNMTWLVVFRFIASLGIGGEWAAGASMVAEVVPERRRVEAGALLYTSAPLGLFLAGLITWWIQGVQFADAPNLSWRIVLLTGLLPALFAFIVRWSLHESERWRRSDANQSPTRLRELFSPEWLGVTLTGLAMALVVLVTWWSCNAFLPLVAKELAAATAREQALDPVAAQRLGESWKALATNLFNLGGLIGVLLTVPVAKRFGRRPMYFVFFLASGLSMVATFGLPMPDHTRLYLFFLVGLTLFGVFGSFTYYLPELFPTRMRSTGAGFCYNSGRVLAAVGPFLVGGIAARGTEALPSALHVLTWLGLVPLAGLLLMPFVVETRDLELQD